MKRFICLLLVLSFVLSLSGCGSSSSDTPFDKLLDHPSSDEIYKRYGADPVEKYNAFNWFYYYNYEWLNCNGELKIGYNIIAYNGIAVPVGFGGAQWTYSARDLSEIRDQIITLMDNKFKRTDHDKTATGCDIYKWQDETANDFSLLFKPDSNTDTIELSMGQTTLW